MKNLYDKMIGNQINYDNNNDIILYIPLIFWFNKDQSLSLPSICLKNGDINISIKINNINNCIIYDQSKNIQNEINNIEIKQISLYIDYIFLNK